MGMKGRQMIGAYVVARRLGARPTSRAWSTRPTRMRPAPGQPAKEVRSYVVRREDSDDMEAFLLHLLNVRPRDIDAAEEEIRRYQSLRHEAIHPLVDLFRHEGDIATVFPQDDGVGLDRLKGYLDRDRERLPDAAVWFVGWHVLGALAQAHGARDEGGNLKPLVHGSLSLRDVRIGWDGEVALHGLCPFLGAVPSFTGDVGTEPSRAWLSPELRRGGAPTPSSDTFAAALVVRSLLTARPPPTPGASVASLAELRPDIPADVAASLDAALSLPQAPRIPSCADLAQRLEGLVRITEGRRALRECMELYQALWGLWSVAAPEVWSQEEPQLQGRQIPGFEPVRFEPSSPAVPGPLPEPIEAGPVTSRSFGTLRPAALQVEAPAPEEQADAEVVTEAAAEPGAEAEAVTEAAAEPAAEAEAVTEAAAEPAADAAAEPAAEAEAVTEAAAKPAADAEAVTEAVAEPAAEAQAAPELVVVAEPVAPTAEELADTDRSSDPLPISRPRYTPTPLADPRAGSRGLLVWGAIAVALGLAIFFGTRGGGNATPPTASASAETRAPRLPAKPPATDREALELPAVSPSLVAAPPSRPSPAKPDPSAATTSPSRASGEFRYADAPSSSPPLVYGQGLLLVESSIDALVYLNGVVLGPAGVPHVTPCGLRNLRLARSPHGPQWIMKDGIPVEIACQKLTSGFVAPEAAPEQPR